LKELIMLKTAATFVLLCCMTSAASSQSKNRWLNGTWEGTGYQTDNNETWTMKLTVRNNRYKIEYPSLKCGGRWIPLSIDGRRAAFIEKITFGLADCVDNGNVVIERLSVRQIAYRFSNRGTRTVTASAILNKKTAPIPNRKK
jgi:hypothetical protein